MAVLKPIESGVNRCRARGAAGGSSFECHARSSRPWSGAIKRDERGEGGREGGKEGEAKSRARSKGDKKSVKHIGRKGGRP